MLHTGLQPESDNYLPYQVAASKTLSPLVRIYRRLGIMRARLSKAARLGSFSNPEALFVLVAISEPASGLAEAWVPPIFARAGLTKIRGCARHSLSRSCPDLRSRWIDSASAECGRKIGIDQTDHAKNGDRCGHQHVANSHPYFPRRVGPKTADFFIFLQATNESSRRAETQQGQSDP
ncbi:hypothetical protein [Bradyrhizobium sp.]|uniref:hypothetical protein n=1 Tax=Bradyrhizobium sp. TaxID=376 RepID=UPI003C21C8E9